MRRGLRLGVALLVVACARCCCRLDRLLDGGARSADCETLCPIVGGGGVRGRGRACFGTARCTAAAPVAAARGTRCAYLSGFPKSSTSFGTWFVVSLLNADCVANPACAPSLADGAPNAGYAFSPWNATAARWDGDETFAAVAGEGAILFTQHCTKHAKFWAGAALRQYAAVDLVVPLRHPLEYPMSRFVWDAANGHRSSTSSLRALDEAFNAMEAKLQTAVRNLQTPGGYDGGGRLFYLKDALERSPTAIARQVAAFLGLEFLAGDALALAAAAAAAPAALPPNKASEHAWIVKRPLTPDGSLAARHADLERWFGPKNWAAARRLWARKAPCLTTALFPWPGGNASAT